MYIFLIIILIILGTGAYAGLKGAPWIPTWADDIDRFLKTAQIKPGEKFYDLGCGDGRLVKAAASAGARAEGFEISLIPYPFAKLRQFFNKNKFQIRYQDFWKADLSDADIIYFFLLKDKYPKIGSKLKKQLKPGTRIICYVWPIPGWKPVLVDKKAKQPDMFLYVI